MRYTISCASDLTRSFSNCYTLIMAKIIKTTVPEVSEIIEPAYDLFDITGLTLAEYVLIVALLGS